MIPADDEVISSPLDKAIAGLPHELSRRRNNAPPRGPALWYVTGAVPLDPEPVMGAYPQGFLRWALRAMECQRAEVLHVCSGALTAAAAGGGRRVDVRPAAAPDVLADGRALPFLEALPAAGVLARADLGIDHRVRLPDPCRDPLPPRPSGASHGVNLN